MNKKLILISMTLCGLIGLAGPDSLRAQSGVNQLQNPGFEDNPPVAFGDHVGHSIAPWVIVNASGASANVVKVDGPGGWPGPNLAQVDDAVGATPAAPRHYLDIAAGSNGVYQSFTTQSGGDVKFGGYFSTRSNTQSTATIFLRQGAGVSGAIVGQTQTVTLPMGDSRTMPWRRVSYTATVAAGTTYSLVVKMDDNMSFDEGFVEFPTDPCCPPWNRPALESMMAYQGSGGIADPFTLVFQPTPQLMQQMQNYIDYLHSMDPDIDEISVKFGVFESTSNAAGGPVTLVGNAHTVTWAAGGNGTPTTPVNFFSMPDETMQVNRWYQIKGNVHLNDGIKYFPRSCVKNSFWMRLQVGEKKPGAVMVQYRNRRKATVREKAIRVLSNSESGGSVPRRGDK